MIKVQNFWNKNKKNQSVHTPDLNTRIFMVIDFIILKCAASLIVEVDTDLFTAMDTIVSQYGCTSCRDPNTSKRIPEYLVILDESHTALVDVYT